MSKALSPRMHVVRGDITKLRDVDVIVNAANSSLLGGGGVDGAIHEAAGPELLVECRKIGGCRAGEARITKSYRLMEAHGIRSIIHTVGPVWWGGDKQERETLANCYRNCLQLAVDNELETIAFPAISTGAFCFPAQEAARIAVQTVNDFLADDYNIAEVRFVCFDQENLQAYRKLFGDESGNFCYI